MARIVFCEDDVLLQKLIRVIFRVTEHEIFIASSGPEALVLVVDTRPDLVFTDISIPGLNGFQLADAIKSHPGLESIPIVFMTAFAQRADIEESQKHCVEWYVCKPFTAQELRTVVEVLLRGGKYG